MRRFLALVFLSGVAAAATTAAPDQVAGNVVFSSSRAVNRGWSDLILVDHRGRRSNVTRSVRVGDRDPELSADGRLLTFVRDRGEDSDLYEIGIDGRGLRQLTSTDGVSEVLARRSRLGDLAFVRVPQARPAASEGWIRYPDGSERRVTSPGEGGTPAWSPDGSRVAFGEDATVVIFDRDGSRRRELVLRSPPHGTRFETWLPEGLIFAYESDGSRLIRADPETGEWTGIRRPCRELPLTLTPTHALCEQGERHVVVRTRTGRTIRTIRLHRYGVGTLLNGGTLSADARRVVLGLAIEEDDLDVWLARAGGFRKLTEGPSDDLDPVLSPDRAWVAFVRRPSETWFVPGRLMVVNVRTRRVRPLRRALLGMRISWSPNGRRLVFERGADLWTIAFRGGASRRLTRGPASDTDPAWSPDGRKIAFLRSERNRTRLVWVSSAGGRLHRVAVLGAGVEGFDWSPDGREFVVAIVDRLALVPLASGRTRTILTDDNPVSSPTWSPDGTRVAYVSGWFPGDMPEPWEDPNAHTFELREAVVATGRREGLFPSTGVDMDPDWR